jgi:aryl-alcohol dehydrogenase-like predicted oxidoreductase
MADLKREGKVQYVGISNVDVEELATAMKVTEIASVQNECNLLDRASEEVLQICENRGLAFIPYYPLASGDLARHKGPDLLATIAKRHNATPAQVALAWLLSRSPIVIPIPGTMSVAHLEENMAATDVRLRAADISALDGLKA